MFRKLGIAMVCAAVLAVASGTTAKAETPAAPSQRQEEEKASEKRLADINKRMDELAGEIRKAEGKTQAELNKLYEEFKVKQGAAKSNLDELRKATNETWGKAKENMDKALENLNGLYERSKAKLRGNKDEAK